VRRPRTVSVRSWDLYLTPSRRELLEGVAALEISLATDGTYTWLGGRRVNARLYELEAQGWLTFDTDTAVPRITGLGRIALRQKDDATS
jgi:hypothetical protein